MPKKKKKKKRKEKRSLTGATCDQSDYLSFLSPSLQFANETYMRLVS